jgi:UDP-N-acetylglucosamine--N-acetylmuramyl-(pentapeptide) pyrophosphoryl-undecaprenol N-acetylglucosamine transferase
MKIGFAAAGTGGHVYPALAIADELRRRGWAPGDLVFFGGDRMEASVVPAAGYPFVGLDIHGLRRRFSFDNLRLVGKVRRARSAIIDVITDEDLRVMVVVGGYVAGPAALAARRTHIPLVVHEANAVPGLANRLIARRAAAVYVAFAPAAERLAGAHVVGSPLRREFATFDRAASMPRARRRYGLDPAATVLGVVGGSQGAQFLNEVAASLAAVARDRRYDILQVTGPRNFDEFASLAADVGGWEVIPFEEEMVDLYAACDLILCRGGAMTISELQATGTPAVVVPLPAGRGYQAENAADLIAAGGAVVCEQGSVDGVAAVVEELLAAPERLATMRDPAAAVDHRKAAAVIADRVEELAHA